MAQPVDPITLEIIQHKLHHIAEEAGITLQRTAVSPIVIESKDIGFNITDHLTRTIVYSNWMPRHGTTTTILIRTAIEQLSQDPGIDPDDQIMLNNPYDGALHLHDIAVVAPVYYQGELLAWTGCVTHHIDIGAATPGFYPGASDWFSEGLKIPPVKLVERGKLRKDLFDLFLLNVRVPRQQGLDLTAQIAANNTARAELIELARRYGLETLRASFDALIDFGERKARQRIRSLPNGTYEFTEYFDFERIHATHCALTIADDEMVFDFSGTDPQADTFINCPATSTLALVHNILFCMVLPDIEANEGTIRPIKVIVPEQTLFSAVAPAACGAASTTGTWKVQSVAMGALSRALLNAQGAERERASAAWGGARPSVQLDGFTPAGRRFGVHTNDGSLSGGGALAFKDGEHATNIASSTNTSMPNIETYEQRYPILFLQRGLARDCEGAGTFRGGLPGESAYTPYRAPRFELVHFYVGKHVPPWGIFGGYPASTGLIALKRSSDLFERLQHGVPSFQDLPHQEEVLPQRSPSHILEPGDVLYVRCQGGGGYGDPLDREPEAVRRDVQQGFVSLQKAREVYGVALGPERLEVDRAATEARRAAIRAERLEARGEDAPPIMRPSLGGASSPRPRLAEFGHRVRDDRPPRSGPASRRLNLYLVWDEGQAWCSRCGASFGAEAGAWRAHALCRERPLTAAGAPTDPDDRVRLREYVCPGCATLLEVELFPREPRPTVGRRP